MNWHKITNSLSASAQFGDWESEYNGKTSEQIYADSRVVIIGIPYDGTATYQRGSKYGPEAVLSASKNLEIFDEIYENIYETGIFTAGLINLADIFTSPEKVMARIYETCKWVADDNKFLVSIGGEHSVSFGAIKAINDKFKNFSVLQLDAHLDLFDNYGGSKYNHACVMKRAIDECGCKATHIGIRVVSEDEHNYINENKIEPNIFRARNIYDNNDWFQQAIDTLNENVYITIDLDMFDPSVLPATGTPVPGGLDWHRTINFLEKVYKDRNVIGLDVVELKPIPGFEASNFLAADLIYKNIGFYKKHAART